jgi:hypothetical protein
LLDRAPTGSNDRIRLRYLLIHRFNFLSQLAGLFSRPARS